VATDVQGRLSVDRATPVLPPPGDERPRVEPERDVAVRVHGLHRSFEQIHVLRGIDLDIAESEFVVLLGRSGGGKSTLLRILAGLDTGYEGTVLVPAARSVVFQEPRLLPWRSVWRNVVIGERGRAARERATAALGEVGLGARADAWPTTLSGGEAQRVALARALVREPALLLLDEPFGALDALTRIRMHDYLRRLCLRHRPAVLLVTHDVDEALVLADRVLVLAEGDLVHDERLDLVRPRRRTNPDLVDARERLLDALGVHEELEA
jgi:sulfonate transport system ATP-binding protein